MADKKPQYAKPASQVDLEARLENGNQSDRVLTTSDNYEPPEPGEDERTYMVEGNDTSAYIGAASEYVTYANETEKPMSSEKNPEDVVAKQFVEAVGPIALTVEASQEQAQEESSTGSSSTSDSSSTTAKKTTSSSPKS